MSLTLGADGYGNEHTERCSQFDKLTHLAPAIASADSFLISWHVTMRGATLGVLANRAGSP